MTTNAKLTMRRGELMAEIFLQELGALFVARPNFNDIVFDFIVGFKNKKGGINTTAVEVKSTSRPVTNSFVIKKKLYNNLAHSNIPAILLVVDVKNNQLYYSWPSEHQGASSLKDSVRIPVSIIDSEVKDSLSRKMSN